jgi:hypothetical protein
MTRVTLMIAWGLVRRGDLVTPKLFVPFASHSWLKNSVHNVETSVISVSLRVDSCRFVVKIKDRFGEGAETSIRGECARKSTVRVMGVIRG